MKISFSFEKGRCAPTDSATSVNLKGGRNEIWFSGMAVTPNPCYKLTASFRVLGGEIEIHIDKTPPPGYCYQCLGMIEFKGIVSEVEAGEYKVKVFYDNKLIQEETITVQ